MSVCQGTINFATVEKSITDDLSNGDANLAWRRLKNKFYQQKSANKLKLKDSLQI